MEKELTELFSIFIILVMNASQSGDKTILALMEKYTPDQLFNLTYKANLN